MYVRVAVYNVCTPLALYERLFRFFVGRALFERTYLRFVRIAELSPVLSLVLGYWESSVVGPVYNRDHHVFQHTLADH